MKPHKCSMCPVTVHDEWAFCSVACYRRWWVDGEKHIDPEARQHVDRVLWDVDYREAFLRNWAAQHGKPKR